jgi:RNA polymerase sigma-70 factor (ECF subfamily)
MTEDWQKGIEWETIAELIGIQEPEACRRFADGFGPRFRQFFVSRGLTSAEAEDLAVTCVSDVVVKIEQYRPYKLGGFVSWVWTIARRKLVDYFRTRQSAEPLDKDYPAILSDQSADGDEDVVQAVDEAMACLSEENQKIIRLHYFGGDYAFSEIGRELGLSEDAARVRHFRALRKLAKMLAADSRIQKLIRPRNKRNRL